MKESNTHADDVAINLLQSEILLNNFFFAFKGVGTELKNHKIAQHSAGNALKFPFFFLHSYYPYVCSNSTPWSNSKISFSWDTLGCILLSYLECLDGGQLVQDVVNLHGEQGGCNVCILRCVNVPPRKFLDSSQKFLC